MFTSQREDVPKVVIAEKLGFSKRSRNSIVILVTVIFIVTVATAIVLYIRATAPQKSLEVGEEDDKKIREVVQDLYPGQPLEIVEPLYVRARFARLEGNVLTYGVFGPVGKQTTEVPLNEKTVFGCTPRYMVAPNGTQIDRLKMYITSQGNDEGRDIPDPPNAKNSDWFTKNVKNGEAIEIRYIKTQDGSVIPRVIYIYKDACQA